MSHMPPPQYSRYSTAQGASALGGLLSKGGHHMLLYSVVTAPLWGGPCIVRQPHYGGLEFVTRDFDRTVMGPPVHIHRIYLLVLQDASGRSKVLRLPSRARSDVHAVDLHVSAILSQGLVVRRVRLGHHGVQAA